MRAVFFGTPEFAVPSLEAMLEGGVAVELVVTRPDRPVGRHARPVPSRIAAAAQVRGLRIARPEKLRGNRELFDEIERLAPDVGVVVAYGRILPAELLAIPRLGFVNVHASLLPRWRGASPVSAAILAGDLETGVVTMRVEEALDSGPIYLERRLVIGADESAASLSGRLSREGGELLNETLRRLDAGSVAAKPQQGDPTYCGVLSRKDGEADWALPAPDLERRLRAFTPWPGLYGFAGGERVKILEARVGPACEEPPGAVRIREGRAFICAGGGTSLEVVRAQRAGRPPVTGVELARSLPPGARFTRVGETPAA